MKKKISLVVICMISLLASMYTHVYAANITIDDCVLGGVKAGWYSNHHYLPEKFNNTALKDVEWVKSSKSIELENYPQSFVIGHADVPCQRVSKDGTIELYGTITRQSHASKSNSNIVEQIMGAIKGELDPLYISVIGINYRDRVEKKYKMLAINMQTPRGIKLLSSKDDVVLAYGEPDHIEQIEGGKSYWYFTPKSLKNNDYLGAGIMFAINMEDDKVYSICVFNSHGYPSGY